MTFLRAFFIIGSVAITTVALPKYSQLEIAILYFAFSSITYFGFLFIVLREQGMRLRLIDKFGEGRAYLYYESFLAFAFFHNGVSLTFINQSSAGSHLFEVFPQPLIVGLSVILFILGMGVKIWSAYVVGIPVYYFERHNSLYGLLFGILNQSLIFLFYYFVEKPFINRTYVRVPGHG